MVIEKRGIIGLDGGGNFEPTQISGLQLWLAADRITGLNDGDPVTTWLDLSGNEYAASQVTAAKKPTYETNEINGKPAAKFDGVDDWVGISNAATRAGFEGPSGTWILVIRPSSTITIGSGNKGLLIKDATGSNYQNLYFESASGKLTYSYATTTKIQSATTSWTGGVPYIVGLRWGSPGMKINVNGILETSNADTSDPPDGDGTFHIGNAFIGAQILFPGFVPEGAFYNRHVSDSEYALIERYVSRKYAIAVT